MYEFTNHKKEAPFQGYMGFGGGATSLTLGGGLSAEALAGLVYANCSAGFRFNNGNTQYFDWSNSHTRLPAVSPASLRRFPQAQETFSSPQLYILL